MNTLTKYIAVGAITTVATQLTGLAIGIGNDLMLRRYMRKQCARAKAQAQVQATEQDQATKQEVDNA